MKQYLLFLFFFGFSLSLQAQFLEEEFTFSNETNLFSGTISYPQGKGPHPAVLLVSGSGAQTRDCTVAGFAMFTYLAKELNKRGFVVLRYDDRNTGKSEGQDIMASTTSDFADDAIAALRKMKQDPRIDADLLGILGHSEGGLVAGLAASRAPELVKFIVSMAGPALRGADILMLQTRYISEANGRGGAKLEEQIRRLDAFYETFLAARGGYDEAQKMLEEIVRLQYQNLPEAQKKYITKPEEYVKTTAAVQMMQLNTRWFRYFLGHNPLPFLLTVRCPMLLMFGEKDLQVPAKENLEILEQHLDQPGHGPATVAIIPEANHLFQKANTGLPKEYGSLKKEFAPGTFSQMDDWFDVILKFIKK